MLVDARHTFHGFFYSKQPLIPKRGINMSTTKERKPVPTFAVLFVALIIGSCVFTCFIRHMWPGHIELNDRTGFLDITIPLGVAATLAIFVIVALSVQLYKTLKTRT